MGWRVVCNGGNAELPEYNHIQDQQQHRWRPLGSGNRLLAPATGTDLHRYVGVFLPGVPNLSRPFTLFNRSALVSTNSLWKLGRGEFKTQITSLFQPREAQKQPTLRHTISMKATASLPKTATALTVHTHRPASSSTNWNQKDRVHQQHPENKYWLGWYKPRCLWFTVQ